LLPNILELNLKRRKKQVIGDNMQHQEAQQASLVVGF
jgi:hypothetical protein